MLLKRGKKGKLVLTIFWVSLLTGTLDGLVAVLLNYKINPALVFKFIAAGLFGKAAFAGGAEMVVSGVILHFIVAFLFTEAYFLLYPFFKSFLKNKYLIAFMYGLFAWLIMNLIVVPLSKIGMHPIHAATLITGVIALVVCIGIPIVFFAERYYSKAKQ